MLKLLHMAGADELKMKAGKGRQSKGLCLSIPSNRLLDTVVGGPLDNDGCGDRKNR